MDSILNTYLTSDSPTLPFDDIEFAGIGQFSEVYRVRCRTTRLPMALKFLRLDVTDPYRIFAFDREVEIHQHLRDKPRVLGLQSGLQALPVPVQVNGQAHSLEVKYFGVDWYPRTLLRLLSDSDKRMSDTLMLFREVALGVQEMHSAGVCHRDLKPDNCLVDEIGRKAVVGDLGTARRNSKADSFRSDNEYRMFWQGATYYVAPERFIGIGGFHDCVAADFYSLGCILYEIATGRILYEQIADAMARLIDANDTVRRLPPAKAAKFLDRVLVDVETSFSLPGIPSHDGIPGPATRNMVEELYRRLCRYRCADRLTDSNHLVRLIDNAVRAARDEERRNAEKRRV